MLYFLENSLRRKHSIPSVKLDQWDIIGILSEVLKVSQQAACEEVKPENVRG